MKTSERVPISFHVDKCLKERLQVAATRNYRPLAKEVEMRLKQSVDADAAQQEAKEMAQ